MTEVLSEQAPVARKEHRCDLCDRPISAGERYHRQVNLGDCGIGCWKECAHCDALVRIIGWDRLTWDDEGYCADSVAEFEPATIAEARLIVGWRHKWRHRDGSLWDVPPTPTTRPTHDEETR